MFIFFFSQLPATERAEKREGVAGPKREGLDSRCQTLTKYNSVQKGWKIGRKPAGSQG
jgi:hypothetical protein